MAATATGRGAQVILDGDAQSAARGAYTTSLAGNLARKLDLETAGTFASGATSDGRTSTGVAAEDVIVAPAGDAAMTAAILVETTRATTAEALKMPISGASLTTAMTAWIAALPTSTPGGAGVVWLNSGVLTLSS